MGSIVDNGPKRRGTDIKNDYPPPPKTPTNILRRPLALPRMEPIKRG